MIVDINNFGPFSADVWGTVSDWVMVLVATVTGLAIWLTFREQLKISKDQQESLNIDRQQLKMERVKYRKHFEPEFIWHGPLGQTSIGFSVNLGIILQKNDARHITIENQENSAFQGLPIGKTITEMKIGDDELLIRNVPVSVKDLNQCYNIKINYQDVNGEKYSQTIIGTIREPNITAPFYMETQQ